ncbi:MAG TPA: hypothetical protein VKU82_16220 [Planctomycetaceae bacterium]|nr:hypothetical protein [Planctomycetaceae bacterium]
MGHGRLLGIIDGCGAPVSALGLLLDVAVPLSADSISCVFVDSRTDDEVRQMAQLSIGAAPTPHGWLRETLAGDCGWPQESVGLADSLEPHRRLAAQRGLNFSAQRWARFSLQRALELTRHADLAVYEGLRGGRTSDSTQLLKTLLGRAACPVAVCRKAFTQIDRAVVATQADGRLDDLLRWGRSWAERLNVPLAVVLCARTARQLTCRMRALEHAAVRLKIGARLSGYRCALPEIAARLRATDLCLTGASSRTWPVELCAGNRTEDLLRMAPCPIAVLPSRSRLECAGGAGEREDD